MDHTEITNNYMSSYNEIVRRYEEERVVTLVEDINFAISNSDMKNVNIAYNKISEWNNSVSNLEGIREALMSHDKSFKLPSVKGYLVIFDQITKEWRFNTEAGGD